MSSSTQVALEQEVARLRAEIQALKQSNSCAEKSINVGNYLLARLEQLGVKVSKGARSCVHTVRKAYDNSRCLGYRAISIWVSIDWGYIVSVNIRNLIPYVPCRFSCEMPASILVVLIQC
jgi:hypothetical protein